MDFVDQRLQTVGEFFRVHVPVAEARVIVFALAEPAVVHDKTIDADGRGFFGERHLAGFIDSKFGCFPGVVNYRARLGIWRVRQNVRDFKLMQQPGRTTQTVI